MTMSDSDVYEVYDLVRRKEPISVREIMRQEPVYSEDEVYEALVELEQVGVVARRHGNLEYDGTTEHLWYTVGEPE